MEGSNLIHLLTAQLRKCDHLHRVSGSKTIEYRHPIGGSTCMSIVVVHCLGITLSGTGIKNYNPECMSTIVSSPEIQMIWLSPIRIFWNKIDNLVKTGGNFSKFIVISHHVLTGTYESIIHLIGSLYQYLVL